VSTEAAACPHCGIGNPAVKANAAGRAAPSAATRSSQKAVDPHRISKAPVVIAAATALVLFWFVLEDSPTTYHAAETSQRSSRASAGERAVVRLSSGGVVVIARTEEDLARLGQLSGAQDLVGIHELVVSGRAFTVPSGTRVRVIGRALGTREVRVESGERTGMSGWVPTEFVN
jgi:hypothetical protein